MKIDADWGTHVGRVREGNEDSAYAGRTVFVVADGLGGHAAGEIASDLAARRIRELDGQVFPDPQTATSTLVEAVRAANRLVFSEGQANLARRGMGTTVTAALHTDDALVFAHVGDSRAYLLREGQPLRPLTEDHTHAGELLEAGHLSREEADRHPERHVLTRAVGLEPDVEVDTPGPLVLQIGDRLLLCSDGLTEAAAEVEVERLLREGSDPGDTCRALIEAALNGGGPDNITVVVLQVNPG